MIDNLAAAEKRRNFHTLDALRGLAALAVVTLHYQVFLNPIKFSSAYLAVDLFFLMSGVVIAHAYDGRFLNGLSPKRFFLMRICRLYPMFFISLMLVASSIALAIYLGISTVWDWKSLIATISTNILFLPSMNNLNKNNQLYPLNFPAWSLFYEIVINLVFALAWPWLSKVVIATIIVISSILLSVLVIKTGNIDGGVYYSQIAIGAVRVTFSFFAGVAIYRNNKWRVIKLPFSFIVLAVVLILYFELNSYYRPIYDLLCVIFVFPVLIVLSINIQPSRYIGAFTFLGLISYPIYIIHVPVQTLLISVTRRVIGNNTGLYAPQVGVIICGGLIILAWVLACYVDPKFRKLMERIIGLGMRKV